MAVYEDLRGTGRGGDRLLRQNLLAWSSFISHSWPVGVADQRSSTFLVPLGRRERDQDHFDAYYGVCLPMSHQIGSSRDPALLLPPGEQILSTGSMRVRGNRAICPAPESESTSDAG